MIPHRAPSPRDLIMNPQSMMQNALIKNKLEEQRESYRKRQEHQQQQQQQRIASPINSPSKQIMSPTPLAFTPTSVLRKMTAEKEPDGADKNVEHDSFKVARRENKKKINDSNCITRENLITCNVDNLSENDIILTSNSENSEEKDDCGKKNNVEILESKNEFSKEKENNDIENLLIEVGEIISAKDVNSFECLENREKNIEVNNDNNIIVMTDNYLHEEKSEVNIKNNSLIEDNETCARVNESIDNFTNSQNLGKIDDKINNNSMIIESENNLDENKNRCTENSLVEKSALSEKLVFDLKNNSDDDYNTDINNLFTIIEENFAVPAGVDSDIDIISSN